MTSSPEPDPSRIGVIGQPPFAALPDPVALFGGRARRFAFLAKTSRLAPYLAFLAELSAIQARLCETLPPPARLSSERITRAHASAMPPIDRAALASEPDLAAALRALLSEAAALDMPAAARDALEAVRSADADTRAALFANLVAEDVPPEAAATHLFAAAALQVHATRLAATLDAGALIPIRTGICPCCGGLPASSLVKALPRVEGARYAACATCATSWNEVRVKCLACGTTKGIGYRSVGEGDAVIKAEICATCHSWVKIFYQTRDAALDPIADDVASLGLDTLMRDTEFRRAGFDPFLIGY